MKSFREALNLNEVDAASELDTFKSAVRKTSEALSRASVLVTRLTSLRNGQLKSQGEELEKLIDAAQRYATKMR